MKDAHVKRFAEISAQAYIDEFPDHVDIDPQWLRQTWELDAAQQRWFTWTWEPYRAAARVKFLEIKVPEVPPPLWPGAAVAAAEMLK